MLMMVCVAFSMDVKDEDLAANSLAVHDLVQVGRQLIDTNPYARA
jgi:hypothetical protein